MGQPNTEPSMEDILASIKRIIAEDNEAQAPRGGPRVRRGPVAVPDPVPDVAAKSATADGATADDVAPDDGDEAGEGAASGAVSAPPAFVPTSPASIRFDPAPSDPEPAAPPAPAEPIAAEEPADVLELTSPLPGERGPILSGAAEQASRNAFAALGQLQVRSDAGDPHTLDGLVADLLKPMLRDWLDRELPAIVERLVAAEVKRVSGRG